MAVVCGTLIRRVVHYIGIGGLGSVGEDPGSKYTKAKELGLKIIDEAEFKRLVV